MFGKYQKSNLRTFQKVNGGRNAEEKILKRYKTIQIVLYKYPQFTKSVYNLIVYTLFFCVNSSERNAGAEEPRQAANKLPTLSADLNARKRRKDRRTARTIQIIII